MTASTLLRELSARGIRVVVRGDRLSLRGPGDVLTTELTERLRRHKPEILKAARLCPTCSECGAVIGKDDLEAWWGLDRVHADCGRRAWAGGGGAKRCRQTGHARSTEVPAGASEMDQPHVGSHDGAQILGKTL